MKTLFRHGIVIALLAGGMSLAEEAKPQTTCPVMGGKINKSLYADVQGKRIYVCCRGCIAAIKKEPAKYIKKLEATGVTPDEAPKAKGAQEKQAHGHGLQH